MSPPSRALARRSDGDIGRALDLAETLQNATASHPRTGSGCGRVASSASNPGSAAGALQLGTARLKRPNQAELLLENSINTERKKSSLGRHPAPKPVIRVEQPDNKIKEYLQDFRGEMDPYEIDTIDLMSDPRMNPKGSSTLELLRKDPSPTKRESDERDMTSDRRNTHESRRDVEVKRTTPSPAPPRSGPRGNWPTLDDSDEESDKAVLSKTPDVDGSRRGNEGVSKSIATPQRSITYSKPEQGGDGSNLQKGDDGPSVHSLLDTSQKPVATVVRRPGQFGGVDPSALKRSSHTNVAVPHLRKPETPMRVNPDVYVERHWGAEPVITDPCELNTTSLPPEIRVRNHTQAFSVLHPPTRIINSVVVEPTTITPGQEILAVNNRIQFPLWCRCLVAASNPGGTEVCVRPMWDDLVTLQKLRKLWNAKLLALYLKLWERRNLVWKYAYRESDVEKNLSPLFISRDPEELEPKQIEVLTREMCPLLTDTANEEGESVSDTLEDLTDVSEAIRHLDLDWSKLPESFLDYKDRDSITSVDPQAARLAREFTQLKDHYAREYEAMSAGWSHQDPNLVEQRMKTRKFRYMGGNVTYAPNFLGFVVKSFSQGMTNVNPKSLKALITGTTKFQQKEWVYASYNYRGTRRWSLAQVKRVFGDGAQLGVRIFDLDKSVVTSRTQIVHPLLGCAFPINFCREQVEQWIQLAYPQNAMSHSAYRRTPVLQLPMPIGPSPTQPKMPAMSSVLGRLTTSASPAPTWMGSTSSTAGSMTPSRSYQTDLSPWYDRSKPYATVINTPSPSIPRVSVTDRSDRERYFDDYKGVACKYPPPRFRWALPPAEPSKPKLTSETSNLGQPRKLESINLDEGGSKRVKNETPQERDSPPADPLSKSKPLPEEDVEEPDDDIEIDEARIKQGVPSELERLKLRIHKATNFWESRATPDKKWRVDDYVMAVIETSPPQRVERQIVRIVAISSLGLHARIEYLEGSVREYEWVDLNAMPSTIQNQRPPESEADVTEDLYSLSSPASVRRSRCVSLERLDSSTTDRTELDAFRANLREQGLALVLEAMDGNCLFRSFARQIFGDSELHLKLRKYCVQFQLCHPDEFQCFLLEDIKTYTSQMSNEGVWGGEPEIVAMCRLFEVNCVIYVPGAPPYEVFDGFGSKRPTIRVSYHGSSHYNSVVVALKESKENPNADDCTSITWGTVATKDSPAPSDASPCTASDENVSFKPIFPSASAATEAAELALEAARASLTARKEQERLELVQESACEESESESDLEADQGLKSVDERRSGNDLGNSSSKSPATVVGSKVETENLAVESSNKAADWRATESTSLKADTKPTKPAPSQRRGRSEKGDTRSKGANRRGGDQPDPEDAAWKTMVLDDASIRDNNTKNKNTNKPSPNDDEFDDIFANSRI